MTLIINHTNYRIDFTFALTVTLMLIFCQQDTVIICLLSSVFHEAGHLILMQLFRQKITDVTFGAFGIRINRLSTCNLSYKKEAIIASGGIGNIEHIKSLIPTGVEGVIVGRALYTGNVDLKEAMVLSKSE